MHLKHSKLFSSLLATHSQMLAGRANLPPVFSVSDLGTCDSTFPNVFRDGGGGGTVNGKNVIVYSDTTTTTGGQEGAMRGFTANTIAFVRCVVFESVILDCMLIAWVLHSPILTIRCV